MGLVINMQWFFAIFSLPHWQGHELWVYILVVQISGSAEHEITGLIMACFHKSPWSHYFPFPHPNSWDPYAKISKTIIFEHNESKGVQISVYIHFYEWSSTRGPWGSIGQHMIFVLKEQILGSNPSPLGATIHHAVFLILGISIAMLVQHQLHRYCKTNFRLQKSKPWEQSSHTIPPPSYVLVISQLGCCFELANFKGQTQFWRWAQQPRQL